LTAPVPFAKPTQHKYNSTSIKNNTLQQTKEKQYGSSIKTATKTKYANKKFNPEKNIHKLTKTVTDIAEFLSKK